MELSVVIGGKTCYADSRAPKSLAIALKFGGAQPNFFGASRARANPLRGDEFIGDTRRDGSCNVVEIRDGPYLLNLQLPAFHLDAALCRPVVYALRLKC